MKSVDTSSDEVIIVNTHSDDRTLRRKTAASGAGAGDYFGIPKSSRRRSIVFLGDDRALRRRVRAIDTRLRAAARRHVKKAVGALN
jgi:hypothetical protein